MTTQKKTRRAGGGGDLQEGLQAYLGPYVSSGGGARGRRHGGGAANMVGDMPYYAANHSGWNSFSSGVGGGGAKAHRPVHAMVVGTFHVGEGMKVKVQHPASTHPGCIHDVLKKFPPGSDLNAVNRALAKCGACFAPWSDKRPGNYSSPRHPVYK